MARPACQIASEHGIHPKVLREWMGLTRYRTILRDLRQVRIDMLPLPYRDLHTSRVYRDQHGLQVNDSLIVAAMQRERMQFVTADFPME